MAHSTCRQVHPFLRRRPRSDGNRRPPTDTQPAFLVDVRGLVARTLPPPVVLQAWIGFNDATAVGLVVPRSGRFRKTSAADTRNSPTQFHSSTSRLSALSRGRGVEHDRPTAREGSRRSDASDTNDSQEERDRRDAEWRQRLQPRAQTLIETARLESARTSVAPWRHCSAGATS
jgi:hypothetical protein